MLTLRRRISVVLCVLCCAIGWSSAAVGQERLNSLIAVEPGSIPFQDLIDLNADPFGFAEGKHHLRVSQSTIDELHARGVDVELLYADLDAAYKAYRESLFFPRAVEEFEDYHSLEQVEAKMMQLAEDFPHIVAMEEIGRSIEDRPIYALRISDNAPDIEPEEPGMLVTGCHHAREWISVSVPLFFADYLAENYLADGQVTRLITYSELWIVPVLNPDGYAYTWSDDEGARWWRKNRRAINPTPAEHTITITGDITGGSYTLGLRRSTGESVTAGPIAYDADAGEVQAAVDDALGQTDQVTVSGSPPGEIVLLFDGEAYTGKPQRLIEVDIAELAGASDTGIQRTVVGTSEFMGVDPNRNYSVGFDGPGASDFPGSETYHGPSAFSEPETQVVRDLLEGGFGRSFVTGLSYHNYSQLVMHPNGYVDEPVSNASYYEPLAAEMARLINESHTDEQHDYIAQQTSKLYIASGVFTDWAHHAMGMTAFIIELRPKRAPFFELPPNEIIPTCQENLPAFLYLAEQTMISGAVTNDLDGDGLIGGDDACPGSASARIDARGCDETQQDADGDGLSGANDLCPDSLPGQQVDEFGCRVSALYGIEIVANVDGVPIGIEPADIDGRSTSEVGLDVIRHEYAAEQTITLTAPESHRGSVFRRWVIDGAPIEQGQSVVIIDGTADVAARVEYVVPVALEISGERRMPDVRQRLAYETRFTAIIRYTDGTTESPRDVTWTLEGEGIGLLDDAGRFIAYDVGSSRGERFGTITARVDLEGVTLSSAPYEVSVFDANSVEPNCIEIGISGPDALDSGATAAFSAPVRRDGEVLKSAVPEQTSWVIEFATDGDQEGVVVLPSISDGMLDAGIVTADTEVILGAAYVNENGTSCIATKPVTLRAVEGAPQRVAPDGAVPDMCGAAGGAAMILLVLGLMGLRFTRR